MPKILTKEIINNTLLADCLVEIEEYQEFKDRVTDQVLKTVTVKGYRKGHAPREKAMQKINLIQLQSTIIQETVERFFPELQTTLDEYLKKGDRQPLSATVSVSPEHTKETEDGFQFRVITTLLPKIDLKDISKIKIELPDGEDIEGRISKKEFYKKEIENALAYFNQYEEVDTKSKKGLKITVNLTETPLEGESRKQENLVVYLGKGQFPESFEKNLIGLKKDEEKKFSAEIKTQKLDYIVQIKTVEEPKLKTLNEVIKNSEEAKKQLVSEEEFTKRLEQVYDRETSQIHQRMQKDLIIKEVLKVVPDFEMEEGKIRLEINRIYSTLEKEAEKKNIEIAELFNSSGLPKIKEEVKTPQDVKTSIEDYVQKEFKLMNILQAIYYLIKEDRITSKDIESLASEIKKDPKKFQVQNPEVVADNKKLENIAYDRLLRAKAYKWIQEQVKLDIKKRVPK